MMMNKVNENIIINNQISEIECVSMNEENRLKEMDRVKKIEQFRNGK